MGLIAELKSEHASIKQSLKEVRDLGLTSDKGQELLFSIKRAIIEHMKKEDEQLYPILEKAVKIDDSLPNLIHTFVLDMRTITKKVMDFFEKYERGGDPFEFNKDLEEMVELLEERINKEESILFHKFEEQ